MDGVVQFSALPPFLFNKTSRKSADGTVLLIQYPSLSKFLNPPRDFRKVWLKTIYSWLVKINKCKFLVGFIIVKRRNLLTKSIQWFFVDGAYPVAISFLQCRIDWIFCFDQGAIDSCQYSASRKSLIGRGLDLSRMMERTGEMLGPVLSQGEKDLKTPVVEKSLRFQALFLYRALRDFNVTMSLLFTLICATPWKK